MALLSWQIIPRSSRRVSAICITLVIAIVVLKVFESLMNIEEDQKEPLPKLEIDDIKDLASSPEERLPEFGLSNLQTPAIKENNVVFSDLERFKQEKTEDSEHESKYRIILNERDVGIGQTVFSQRQPLEEYDNYPRENATFFSLVRNRDLEGILESIISVEERFNFRYHYDWVFANDQPFDAGFKIIVKNIVSGNAYFEEIPHNFWSYPPWIDEAKANKTRKIMKSKNIKYGDSISYRHMCRFNSGFFYQLPIMKRYKYYWRVEPDIQYRCDIFDTDHFKEMRVRNKKYAFTLAPLELHTTVENLWETAHKFFQEEPKYVSENNNAMFMSEDGGQTFNMCHFWSNFEIGDMDFFRLEAYSKYFEHIDRAGGFYYSRWGDAPVHSIAVSYLLPKDELHFLENTGYFHNPNGDCPWDPQVRLDKRCICLTKNEATWSKASCIPKWFEIHNIKKPEFAPHFTFVNQHHPPDEDKMKEEEVEEDQED